MVFDTPMIWILALYLDFEGAKNIHIFTSKSLKYLPAQPMSSKAPNQDLKDMDVLCTFKIDWDSPNLEYGCIKDQ